MSLLFLSNETRLILNFGPLLRSQEWQKGNSWFVTLSLAQCAMREPPNLHKPVRNRVWLKEKG